MNTGLLSFIAIGVVFLQLTSQQIHQDLKMIDAHIQEAGKRDRDARFTTSFSVGAFFMPEIGSTTTTAK